MTPQFAHPAPGVACLVGPLAAEPLVYRVDSAAHLVVVSDGRGRVVSAFGGRGRRPGRLHTPLDLAFVRPEFIDERLPDDGPSAVWLAVADYGNRRIQLFECDGAPVAELVVDAADGSAWAPCALRWRGPWLDVDGLDGARLTVHLSAALLARSAAGVTRRRTAAAARGVRH